MPKTQRPLTVIFQEIHQGDQIAFNELFLLYYDRLVVFAIQYVKQEAFAEEITSELFVKLWLKRDRLLQVSNPEVYLYVAVKNAALNHLRSLKKHQVLTDEAEGFAMESIPDGGDLVMERKELYNMLNRAVAALPEQRRIIFKLIKEDGLRCREVARILDLSTRTVESQMYKAVKTLADQLAPYLGYHPQKQFSRKQVFSKLPLFIFF